MDTTNIYTYIHTQWHIIHLKKLVQTITEMNIENTALSEISQEEK